MPNWHLRGSLAHIFDNFYNYRKYLGSGFIVFDGS